MITTTRSLTCNYCGEWVSIPGTQTAREARRLARAAGWRTLPHADQRGRLMDICPRDDTRPESTPTALTTAFQATALPPHPPYAVDAVAVEDAELSGRTTPHIAVDGQCQCTCPACEDPDAVNPCICVGCQPFDHEHVAQDAA